MPQLTVRGVPVLAMAEISGKLVEELAGICGCGPDNFTIDCLPVVSVFGGAEAAVFPFVEVAWFERGSAVRNHVAEAVTRHIRSAGVPDVEVAFKVYAEEGYYVNGVSCDKL